MKLIFDRLNNQTRRSIILLALPLLLLLVGTACRLDAGGPHAPYDPVSTSLDAAAEVETILQSANPSRSSGSFAFTLNEAQVSSYLVDLLKDQKGIAFKNPQVYLRHQQVEIYGRIEQEYFSADTCFILTASPTEEGTLQVNLLYAEVGIVRLSKEMLDGISTMLQEMLKMNQWIEEPFSSGYRIETLDISNGMITLTGSKR